MFRISEFIMRRWGIVGLMNFNAANGLLVSYLVVQAVRHGAIFRMPTLGDLLWIILAAICLNVWLVGSLYRDWRNGGGD